MSQNNPQEVPKHMEVDRKQTGGGFKEEKQNGPFSQVESVILTSKKLEDDLLLLGLKIKHHEDNIRILNTQKNKLDESLLDLQVVLRKYHSSVAPDVENQEHSTNQSDDETIDQILRHNNSAAAILYQLNLNSGTQADEIPMIEDVLGVVATLGTVDDDNLSRLLAEYLGDAMLGIVCKNYESKKALETRSKEGIINMDSGLHGLGASIGRNLDDRFLVICLEDLRPYPGEFVANDPQRRLDILKPKLHNGESPPGFIGYAVNMVNVESTNLIYVTTSGYGLRETLFYYLFSRLQVYRTTEDMESARLCIDDGAISLDGGMIRAAGVFFLGKRREVSVKFPKSYIPDKRIDSEVQLKEMKWKKEKLEEDMKREQGLLVNARHNFGQKKEEFVKFLTQSSSYATQQQNKGGGEKFTSN